MSKTTDVMCDGCYTHWYAGRMLHKITWRNTGADCKTRELDFCDARCITKYFRRKVKEANASELAHAERISRLGPDHVPSRI